MNHIIYTYKGKVYTCYKKWDFNRIERVLTRLGAEWWEIGLLIGEPFRKKNMKWIYTTEGNEHSEVPLDWDILVQLKPSNNYYVLNFRMDEDYGMVAPLFEEYITPQEIRRFTLITG